MRNGFVFFLALLAALLISWASIVLGSHAQIGSLATFFDETEGQSYPARTPGVAAQGQLVYASLGCAACHTQQVRRPTFGADQARGWGERQSVARDYIFQPRPQLGASRIGPDLANLAGRQPSAPDAEDLLKLLYSGSETHPSYKFLFEEREILGQRSDFALKLTGNLAPAAGREIVPTERARSLVAYLLNSNQSYAFPEAQPLPPPAAEQPDTKSQPTEKHDVTPVPAAAPDEKKSEPAKQ